jgi:hypothetical protein
LLAIENGSATDYIKDLSYNVKRGLQGKVERGGHSGLAPLGYINDLTKHTIEPHPVAFDIVRRGWDLILNQGYTVAEVKREWTRMGLTGVTKKTRRKPPSHSVVYRVFSNPFYAGKIPFKGTSYQGAHRPMVTMREFERAQVLLGRGVRRRERTFSHAFSGLFKCPVCGCSIVGETKHKRYKNTKREVDYTYYHCTGFKGCSKSGVIEDAVQAAVVAICDQAAIPPSFAAWMRDQVMRSGEQTLQTVEQSLQDLERQVGEVQTRLHTLRELRIDGELGASEYAELKAEAEQKLKLLNGRQDSVRTENSRIQSYVLEKLDAAERAGQYRDVATEFRRGIIESLGPSCFLTLEKAVFELDPVIAKIAAFEPSGNSFQSAKYGDSMLYVSRWLGLVDDILSVAQKTISSVDSTRPTTKIEIPLKNEYSQTKDRSKTAPKNIVAWPE